MDATFSLSNPLSNIFLCFQRYDIPNELIFKIIYEHKGLQHPLSFALEEKSIFIIYKSIHYDHLYNKTSDFYKGSQPKDNDNKFLNKWDGTLQKDTIQVVQLDDEDDTYVLSNYYVGFTNSNYYHYLPSTKDPQYQLGYCSSYWRCGNQKTSCDSPCVVINGCKNEECLSRKFCRECYDYEVNYFNKSKITNSIKDNNTLYKINKSNRFYHYYKNRSLKKMIDKIQDTKLQNQVYMKSERSYMCEVASYCKDCGIHYDDEGSDFEYQIRKNLDYGRDSEKGHTICSCGDEDNKSYGCMTCSEKWFKDKKCINCSDI